MEEKKDHRVFILTKIGVPLSILCLGFTTIMTNGGFSRFIIEGSAVRSIFSVIGLLAGATLAATILLTILTLIFAAIPSFIFRKKEGADKVIFSSIFVFLGILLSILFYASSD